MKFLFMLGASFVVMYFVMFLNVEKISHIYLNTMRVYMTLLMICPMALIMLFVMRKMYQNRKLNTIITVTAVVVFVLTFMMMRNQTFIGDRQFMKGMIPHHSIAVLVSNNANILDPELKKLSEEIIKTQEEEIAQMRRILERLGKSE
jgi:uncharacterized protein (DUF305 family)